MAEGEITVFKKELVVTNLTHNLTEAHVDEIFAEYGKIERLKIPTGNYGIHWGRAFVTFSTEEEAAKAMEYMNGAQIDGEVVKVEYKDNDPRKPWNQERGGGGGNRDRHYGSGRDYRDRERDRDRTRDRGSYYNRNRSRSRDRDRGGRYGGEPSRYESDRRGDDRDRGGYRRRHSRSRSRGRDYGGDRYRRSSPGRSRYDDRGGGGGRSGNGSGRRFGSRSRSPRR